MAISSLDLTTKAELTFLAELVADLRAAASAWEPLLVGALARDLLLFHAHNIPVSRATADIDIAFAVADWEEFSRLRAALLASAHFTAHNSMIHRFFHRQQGQMDIVPFGGLELPDGSIAWPPRGDEVMTVVGFRDALASAMDAMLPKGQRVLVVSLSMLVVLKLVAWSDRHARSPGKDAADLLLILKNYLDAGNQSRLYDEAAHLLDQNDFDYERAGAWLAGHDAAAAVRENSGGRTRTPDMIVTILSAQSDPDGALRLVGEVGAREAESMRLLLVSFLRGFKGENTP
jgi:predicted nucleotidyltransferase